MKEIVKIGAHYVVKGMSVNEYAHLVGIFNEVKDYNMLTEALILLCEVQGGCDPLWDFPLDEMQDSTIEDQGYFYVELFDGEEPRYFETLITIDEIKKIL